MIKNCNYANQSGRQGGGTIIGIIIGLIIGLAIALLVAIVITKSTLPFMNKVGKQDKSPELTVGQASDPNKPLYTNNGPAKDAAKDFVQPGVAPTAADGKPVVTAVPPNAAAATVAAPATAASTIAKPGGLVANIAAAKPDDAGDKFTYYLQAGAFRDQAAAENSKAKLALAGFEASISDQNGDGGQLYRVRIGPFNQLEAMNRVRGKLSDSGIDVAVVRIAK